MKYLANYVRLSFHSVCLRIVVSCANFDSFPSAACSNRVVLFLESRLQLGVGEGGIILEFEKVPAELFFSKMREKYCQVPNSENLFLA